ncbi:MAG: XRE family transcriptional regulator [Lamprobacter sp.]|uniref:XRE family transcriptional regulator n=1 Tax=Lamprobacter sp. TaxID=3100796 RepID=UPI002B257724|nr:XRE family transcriptional regulator [Lamprobacter sp.]MEA3641807.1 XRE family transcriptional regulator [Lamprobacter sp.]
MIRKDIHISFTAMGQFSLHSAADVQQSLSAWIKARRRMLKLSRNALAARSTVPAPTIKKFETTGQISLRQFLLLWQSVDDLSRLQGLTDPPPKVPASIEEVLAQ